MPHNVKQASSNTATQPPAARSHLLAASLLVLLLPCAMPVAASDQLYQSLGGNAGLTKIVDDMVEIMMDDVRINFTFAQSDLKVFSALLAEQLCELSGGPCTYTGRDMTEAHEGLDITNAQFNALAEDLYLSMTRNGVPYRVQNRLMSLLAPMQRDMATNKLPNKRPRN